MSPEYQGEPVPSMMWPPVMTMSKGFCASTAGICADEIPEQRITMTMITAGKRVDCLRERIWANRITMLLAEDVGRHMACDWPALAAELGGPRPLESPTIKLWLLPIRGRTLPIPLVNLIPSNPLANA